MSNLSSVQDELIAAVKDVRDDKTSTNWALASFPSVESWDLICIGSGSGGVDEMKQSVNWGDASFGILRRTFQFDQKINGMGATNVTKFIFVPFRPDNLPLKRKTKLSVYEAQIKKVFQPFHMDLEVSKESEIDEKIVEDLIMRVTMKADMQTTGKPAASFVMGGIAMKAETATSAAASAKKQADTLATSFAGNAGGASVSFENLEEASAIIADVRNDSTSTTWCLFGYKDAKTIGFLGKGDGQVPEELIAACPDGKAAYGLFRITEQIELTKAVKFCYVIWSPPDVPVMDRAKISTHKNAVQPIFRPYHVDFTVGSRNEISFESVMDHVMSLSGTKSKVTDKKPAVKEDVYVRKTLGSVPVNEKIAMEIEDLPTIQAAIKSVRADSDETEWCVAGTIEKGKEAALAFVSKGSGFDSFLQCISGDPGRVMYGFLRRTQVIDATVAVKFVFITLQGVNIPSWLKAKVSTYRGAVVDVFHPYHCEMVTSDANDISEKSIKERLGDKSA